MSVDGVSSEGGRNNGGNCDDDGHTVGTVICTSQTPFTLNLPLSQKNIIKKCMFL